MMHQLILAADYFVGERPFMSSDMNIEINYSIKVEGGFREGYEYEVIVKSVYMHTGEVDFNKRPVIISLPQLKKWAEDQIVKFNNEYNIWADLLEPEYTE